MSEALSSESKIKELNEIEKENKEYYTQVEQMNNRIKNLKLQQEDLNKRINSLKAIEHQKAKFRSFKQKNKNDLLGYKIKTDKMIKVKRQFVHKEKENRSRSLQLSRSKCQQEKNKNFEERRTEHLFTSSTLTQYNNYKTNLNKYKIVKAKMNQVQYQTEKEKQKSKSAGKKNIVYIKRLNEEKDKSDKLKSQMMLLEKNEAECLSQLNSSLKLKSDLMKNKSLNILNGDKTKKPPSFISSTSKKASRTQKESLSLSKQSINGNKITKIKPEKTFNKIIPKANPNVRVYSASKPHKTKSKL